MRSQTRVFLTLIALIGVSCSQRLRLNAVTSSISANRGYAATEITRARFRQAFEARMAVMERTYGIKFDQNWKPFVEFEIPKVVHPALEGLTFAAHYDQVRQSFVLNPTHFERVERNPRLLDFCLINELDTSNPHVSLELRNVITHELAHALADQLSRRLGYGKFPGVGYGSGDHQSEIAADMLCEGIARYVERDGPEDVSPSVELIPVVFSEASWADKAVRINTMYDGGHWLVYPIIKRFGLRVSLQYFFGHPFRLASDQLRAEAIAYQQRALRELALPAPQHK